MRVIDTTAGVDLSDPLSIESYWDGKLIETTELMEPLFYMFARIDFPVRTDYVLGYLAVRQYLQDHGLRTKDILGIDWRRVLRAQHEEENQTCT